MTSFPWPLTWTYPALALAGAPLAFVGVVWLARRGLGNHRVVAAWAAALVRGIAAALAVLAAAGPMATDENPARAERLFVAPDGAPSRGDRAIHWPSEAGDAAAALEVLRGARDPTAAAQLVLATDGRTGVPPGSSAVREALGPVPGLDPAVVALGSDDVAPRVPSDRMRLVVPAGASVGAPVALVLDSGRNPFAGGEAIYTLGPSEFVVPTPPGARRVALPAVELPAGSHLAVVRTPDRLPAATLVTVDGPLRVLLLTRSPRETLSLSTLLEAQGVEVMVAGSLSGLAQALRETTVIIVGPGTGTGPFGTAVARRVHAGAGLLVLGGPERAGISRLHGSELSTLLPVLVPEPPPPEPEKPKPPPPEEDPEEPPDTLTPELDEAEKRALRVALLVVMDRSGSMAGPKLAMARAAAVAAAKSLAPSDRIGVLAFNDGYQWVAPFQEAQKLDTLYRRMREMDAWGGTNFYPALKVGYRSLGEQPCGIRHIVLFTDGNTQAAVWGPLILAGTREGVTLSTVAVGGDADGRLLGQLAGWGRGGHYVARDPKRLPEILTMDTREFGQKVRDEKRREQERKKEKVPQPDGLPMPDQPENPVDPEAPPAETKDEPPPRQWPRTPVVKAPAPALAGLETVDWPPLPSAEEPEARRASHVALEWESGAPALTFGRAGLGRTAVLAADVSTRQAEDFRRWEHAGQFLAQLVRSLAEPDAGGGENGHGAPAGHVSFVELEDGRSFARVDGAGAGVLDLQAVGGGDPVRTPCAPDGPRATGPLPAMPARGVLAGFYETEDGKAYRVVGVSPGPGAPALPHTADDVAREAGLALHDSPPTLEPGEPAEEQIPVELPLLVGAISLLLVEAGLRRLARV